MDERPLTRTWIARSFTLVEDVVYIGLAILLAGSAAVLLISAFVGSIHSLVAGSLDKEIISLLDRLLLILLVVELLYTVQVSFCEHAVMPEPFLLIGLIAVIRRILMVTAELGQASKGGLSSVEPLIWGRGVLAVLVVAIAGSLVILRNRGPAAVAERA